ncbi:MAG: DUF1905 domain-containing protein [Chloracidobacterium sp.]|nr:DUF1905 domain-containing protein [Chloracidobacterium sp.]MCC6825261.1 DUF1905 domain-containing protein [Acidobacteriota bacterium]MCO5332531.1 YdeI/OmpD-associated family protein [Pyrinomonadaceae bacterium]
MAKPVKSLKLKTKLMKWEDSGWHSLVIDKKTVDRFGFEGIYKRIVCTLDGGEPFQCALMPAHGDFYIIINQQKRDAVGIAAGDIVSVLIEKDESKYGLPMPEEFREVLDQDPQGDKLFHALTPGKQRSLLHHLGTVKDIDMRIRHALIIVEHLKEHGKIVDKILHAELRAAAWQNTRFR